MKKTLALMTALSLSCFAAPHAGAADTSYTFGFVPQQSAKVRIKRWGPSLKHLGQATGHKLVVRTAPTIPQFEAKLAEKGYDIAYMNPVHYTYFAKKSGYRAWAKQKGKKIKGIVVTRKDSPVKELKELEGKTLAFPAPAAFAASVLPRSYMKLEGIGITPKYVGSHDSVYHGIARGLYPAGGGIQRTFGNMKADVRDQLRVLWTTQGYTPHAFAALPGVPAQVVADLQAAFVAMFDDPEGRKLLEAVGFKKGAEAAADGDWADVRGLGIDELPK